VFEAWSPSTRGVDPMRKTEEYKTIPTMRYSVLIEPDTMRVAAWGPAGADQPWVLETFGAPETEIALTTIDVRLSLSDIDEGVELEAPPNRSAYCMLATTSARSEISAIAP
jgi:hypothetical protein